MMRKFISIIFSILIINLLLVLPIFANNDINMNINANSNSDNSINSNATSNSNTTTNSYIDTTINSQYSQSSARVSTTTDEFGLTNILNIMLVVIGILLVLLAIAILIRLKN